MKTAKENFAMATKYATMVGAPLLIIASIYQLTKSKGKGKMEGIAFPVLGLLTGITAFNAVYTLKPMMASAPAVADEAKPADASKS